MDNINGLAFTPDGGTILSGSNDGSVRAWSANAEDKPPASVAFGETLPVWDGYGPAAFLSVNGHHALTVFTNEEFIAWDALALRPGGRFPAPLTNLSSAAISSDGRLIAFANWQGQVALWDRSGGGVRWTHQLSKERAYRLTFSADDSRLSWLQSRAGLPEALLVCASEADREPALAAEVSDFVTALSFGADGSNLGGGLYGGDAVLWRPGHPAGETRFSGHRFQIAALALSPDQHWLVTGSLDGIRLWDAASGKVTRHLRPRPTFFRRAAFAPDGHRIAVAGGDGQITLFDTETFDELVTFKSSHTPQGLAFTPDGDTLVVITGEELRVWRTEAITEDGRAVDLRRSNRP